MHRLTSGNLSTFVSEQRKTISMRICEDYSLLEHNTFHLDIKTRWFVEYESEEDLQKLLQNKDFFSQSFWHIGHGSNLLFLGDYNGVIVHSGIKGIETIKEDNNHVWLKVGASEDWDTLVAYCVRHGWGGLENLSLIPGEVGASAFQNIGAYGVEVADCIVEVHAYFLKTGEKRIFTNKECCYSYRHSFFKESENRGLYFITHVIYCLSKIPEYHLNYSNVQSYLEDKDVNLQTVRKAIITIRQAKLPDPAIQGNAGSFFTNPYICLAHYERLKIQYPQMPYHFGNDKMVKIPAAWLIEQCGWKGKSIGGAAVSDKQPLVIINQYKTTGKEIAHLAEEIQKSIQDKFGIKLQPEVNYL